MNYLGVGGGRPGLFLNNSRFYIICAALFLSGLLGGLLRIGIESDMVYLIRLQQTFGFVALGLWYLALLATPLAVAVGKRHDSIKQYLHIRRALGVSAAYYAGLHTLIALFWQLGGIGGLSVLPRQFLGAVILGGLGMLVLVLMAVTSFDRVVAYITFKRWKWLHRLGYGAAVFVYLHVWMLGSHMDDWRFALTIYVLLSVLAMLESWRIAVIIERLSGEINTRMRWVVCLSLCALLVGMLLLLPRVFTSYHGQHEAASEVRQ